MGADIIIGVDVQNNLKGIDKLNSAPDILSQIIDLTTKNNHQSNVGLTDTYIKVNVEGYSSASFTPAAIDSLMHRGEVAAASNGLLCSLSKRKSALQTRSYPNRTALIPCSQRTGPCM